MTTRNRWLRRLLWLTGFGCLWLNVLDDPPLWTGAYVQDVTHESAVIAKVTAEPESLHLTVLDAGGDVVAQITSSSRRRHAWTVAGLKAGQEYAYMLAARDGAVAGNGDHGSFRTAPEPMDDRSPVKFAFVGDSGGLPWWVWLQKTPILHLPSRYHWFPTKWAVTTVGAAMAAYQPDFALHLGDVVYPAGMQAHYSPGFFRPFAELLLHAPMYAVVGNHDVMDAAGQQLLSNFHQPSNDVTGDERCFSMARGPVRIIVLDTNTWFSSDQYRPDHPVHRYLVEQLEICTEPWIIVAAHHPIRSASRQGPDGALQATLLPELVRRQVSVYLSGHDHCYQRFGPNEKWVVPLVVSGGGGKSLYDITSDPRFKIGAEQLHKAYHWCAAAVSGREFRIVARDVDNAVLDDFQLALPAGEDLVRLRALNPGRAARIDAL